MKRIFNSALAAILAFAIGVAPVEPVFAGPFAGTGSGASGGGGGGSGTVTSTSITANDGLSGSVTNPTTTPAFTIGVPSKTGTGNTFVMQSTPTLNTPTFVAPALGTPTSGIATNLTGTASGLTAGTVTTNANLTGVITSTGNATSTGAQTGTGSTFVMQTSPSLTTPALSGETYSTSATVTAGTNAQGQGALTSDYSVITTAAANPSGATLPTATAGRRIVVVNKGANPVSLYPATGAAIDALSANAAITVPVNGKVILDAASTTLWYSTLNATTATTALTGTLQAAQFPALTGDVTTSAGALATTLATVNSNVGTFTNATITVNGKGLITAASTGSGGGGTPGGSNTQMQYNNAGAFGGAAGLTTDGNVLTNTQAIAATSTDGYVLATSATATVGAQKFSSRLRFSGSGWKTNATAGAQPVDFIVENQPVQGTANPTGNLTFSTQVNGAGYASVGTLSSAGLWTIAGGLNSTGGSAMTMTSGQSLDFNTNAKIFPNFGVNQIAFEVNSSKSSAVRQAGFAVTPASIFGFNSTTIDNNSIDTAIGRNAAGVAEINNGSACSTVSNCRDLKLRNIIATGGLQVAIVSKTATYTATANDHTILVDASAGAVTINLPDASTVTGQIYYVKKTDSSGNTVTIDPNGTQVIDGALTKAIASQWGMFGFQSNGTAWFIIAAI